MTEQQIRNDPNFIPISTESDDLWVDEEGTFIIYSTTLRNRGYNRSVREWLEVWKNVIYR